MNSLFDQRSLYFRSFLLVMGLFCSRASSAYAETRSIEEFMTFQEKWSDFIITGYVWQVEGRYALISDGTMTFANCPLPFRMTAEQASLRGNTGVVEVSGKMIQEEKGLAFQVEKLTPRPRDLDRLKAMRFGIGIEKPEQWYQLADWARGRGAFYRDKELTHAAIDLDRNGIIAESRLIAATDQKGFHELIQKARAKRVDEALLQQLIHHSLQARFQNLSNSEFQDQAYQQLQKDVHDELNGAKTVLASVSEDTLEEYRKDPNAVFEAAKPDSRLELARLFYVEVAEKRILAAATADGKNGFAIADRIAAEIPERKDLALKYEDLAVAWKQKQLPVMTRQQLVDFTQRLEGKGKVEISKEAKLSWLKSRESLYRQDGARGLADLGQQWMQLLGDSTAAAQFYIEAWTVNHDYTPAIEWLTSHQYQLVDQTWLKAEEVANMPLSPREKAIREGRIEVGMTSSEVQAALGAVPTSYTRVASRKQVTEWWVYPESGIVIQLVKTSRDRESVVLKIDRLNLSESGALQ